MGHPSVVWADAVYNEKDHLVQCQPQQECETGSNEHVADKGPFIPVPPLQDDNCDKDRNTDGRHPDHDVIKQYEPAGSSIDRLG